MTKAAFIFFYMKFLSFAVVSLQIMPRNITKDGTNTKKCQYSYLY